MRRPCKKCPWRRDAPPAFWHPDEFRKIWTACQDDGLELMGCHKFNKHPPDQVEPCQGWIRVLRFDSVGVRLGVMQGKIRIEEVLDEGGPELVESFWELMEVQGIEPPDRNQFKPE